MQIKKNPKIAIKIKKAQNIDELCSLYNISKLELYEKNKTTTFVDNDIVILPKPYQKSYVVKPLDTIETIANKLNVGTNEVYCATKGKIFIGQKIFL